MGDNDKNKKDKKEKEKLKEKAREFNRDEIKKEIISKSEGLL